MATRSGLWSTTFIGKDPKAGVPDGQAPVSKGADPAPAEGATAGWTERELFREEWGSLAPRVAVHGGRVISVHANIGRNELEVRAYTPGKGWADLGRIHGVHSQRPPALVSHGGFLYAFTMSTRGQSVQVSRMGADDKWTTGVLPGLLSPYLPGVAVFGGNLHVVHYYDGPSGKGLNHSVLVDGKLVTQTVIAGGGDPGSRLALVSHAEGLHLVHTRGDLLKHFLFDGTAWKKLPDGPATGTQQRAVSVASYDGKLYAAYNVTVPEVVRVDRLIDQEIRGALGGSPREVFSIETTADQDDTPLTVAEIRALPAEDREALVESLTETGNRISSLLNGALRGEELPETTTLTHHRAGYQVYDGKTWSGEVVLPVNAQSAVSLAAYSEPGDAERGRLLLVYGGVETFVYPPPPPPAVPGPVVAGSEVSKGRTDLGAGGWTKVNHAISAKLRKNADGVHHVEARWRADSFWIDGVGIAHWESGRVSGKIKLAQAGSPHALINDHHFSQDFTNSAEVIAVWEVPPGHYEVTISTAEKRLGGWWPWKNLDCPGYYSDIELESESVVITVPSK